jgi:3-phenylpropionate/cinnamic acid dioxygenase small subunit
MGKKKVSVEDRLEVNDILARYCWHVDEGDAEEWADLWTEDGVFAGVTPEPIRGREQLKFVPGTSLSGGCRHNLINVVIDYGDTEDEITVRCYNLVFSWMAGGAINCNAVALYKLVRRGDTWKIKSNQVRLQLPPNAPQQLPPGFPTPANQKSTWPPL